MTRSTSRRAAMRAGACIAWLAGALALGACQGGGGLSLPGVAGAAPAEPMAQGYTCCNLHYENDWISDANWGALPMIPAGTPAQATGYGRYRVAATVGGKPMRLGLDYGREQLTLPKFAAQLIVPQDPKAKIAAWPAAVQRAVAQGRVMNGMTREQVLVSLGYPMASETPSIDGPIWRYWLSSFDEYQVVFGADGRVKEIIGAPTVLTRAVAAP